MSRTLKRVPLDFAWPLKKVWDGYLNPHFKPCPQDRIDCFSGSTAASKWLEAISRLIAMVGEEAAAAPHAAEFKQRGRSYPHPYLEEWGQAPRKELPREVHAELAAIPDQTARMRALRVHLSNHPPQLLPLTDELRALIQGLAPTRNLNTGLGSNADYEICRSLVRAAGMKEDWGTCKVCEGHGIHPDARAVYEAWTPTEPPTGDGFQLWGTTNEGAPYSPVFSTIEELCAWCETGATTFGSNRATADQWRKMLDADFVCHTEEIGGITAVFM